MKEELEEIWQKILNLLSEEFQKKINILTDDRNDIVKKFEAYN